MRSTTFLTTALQIGTLLCAADAARPHRRQAPENDANEDSVQWKAWSATTFKTVTTPYNHPEEAISTYNSWAATSTMAHKPLHHEEDDEEWNDWEDDEYTTTKKPLALPTTYNPFPTTSSKYYKSWEAASHQYNSWEHAKPSPTTFMYQSWVSTAKRFNGNDEDNQGRQEASIKTPEVYQTLSKAVVHPVEEYNTWSATPTHVISYTTKVITIEEYQTWSQTPYSTTQAYQTWSATAVPTKPVEQVQEWAQWEGQQTSGNGHQHGQGNQYGNDNGNGYQNGPYSFTTTTPFITVPTNAANGADPLAGAGLGGLSGGLGALGGLGLGGL